MDEEMYFSDEEMVLLERFEKMIQVSDVYFFDSEELSVIIDCYLDNSDLKRASIAIRFAIEQYPLESYFKLKKSQYFMQLGKIEKALKILDNEDFDPEDPEMLLLRAQIYCLNDRSVEAIQILEGVASLDQDFAEESYLLIASEWEKLGDFKKSFLWLKKALDENPENSFTLIALSNCYELMDDAKGAVDFFTEFIQNHPYNEDAWFYLGSAYCKLQEYEKGIEAYDYVLAINDQVVSANFNKGNALSNLGRIDEAIEAYLETIDMELQDPLTYLYLGECYEKKRDFTTALKYYNLALENTQDPPYAEIACGLAICHNELNQPELAEDFIDIAIKEYPENTDYWFVKADIKKHLGAFEESLECYQKTINLGRTDWDVWLDYSDTLFEYGAIEQGFSLLNHAIELFPETSELFYRLAANLTMFGHLKEAVNIFSIALSLNKNGYKEAFEYYPNMKDIQVFLDLVLDSENI